MMNACEDDDIAAGNPNHFLAGRFSITMRFIVPLLGDRYRHVYTLCEWPPVSMTNASHNPSFAASQIDFNSAVKPFHLTVLIHAIV